MKTLLIDILILLAGMLAAFVIVTTSSAGHPFELFVNYWTVRHTIYGVYLFQYVLLGPTVTGPLLSWYHRGYVFGPPNCGFANIWNALTVSLLPEIILLLTVGIATFLPGRFAPALVFGAIVVQLLGLFFRGIVGSIGTLSVFAGALVGGDTARVRHWTWLDIVGLLICGAWAMCGVRGIYAICMYGLGPE